ncbi:hypothetical protein Patl1_33511 [Pistacia atlantica]|uniref:Uncharacterized protein n=1 Tax=Pistacia atlantica TaxID=434234 RepID=A0ACC0ZUW7_9ROSI|nr:hypothetical protein Patl1_33511 [Pistacia atlantica]
MAVKPTVALRAVLVGGIAVFAKIAGTMKAAGGAKLGAGSSCHVNGSRGCDTIKRGSKGRF